VRFSAAESSLVGVSYANPEQAVVARGRARSYGPVAWCYDALAGLASGGAIEQSKLARLDEIEPGDRVAVAGAGTGSDAVAAALLGARVTAVDVAPAMLARLARRAERAECIVHTCCEDLFDHHPDESYDVVLAPYILNVFGEKEARAVLARLVSWLRPGGRLFISDFAPASAAWSPAGRVWIKLYFATVDAVGAVLRLAPLHGLHDYAEWLDESGAELIDRRGFSIWRGGPHQFESIFAVRRS
jgi:demethylmenaquinone methyltransferase/2-methoxy-6-polyprenyl-1,4-benzoquinol methylase